MTSRLSIRFSCSTCFRLSDHGEYCVHCNRMICHECLMDHRMELKKNILKNIHRYRGWRRRTENNRRELVQKLENLYVHIECCADELIDQIDTYLYSMLTQIDEQKFFQETNSSEFTEQHSSDSNISLTIPSIVPIRLLGEFIPSDSSTSHIFWTMTLSFLPFYLIFEPKSSKLFISSQQGDISVYNYTKTYLSLIDSFRVSSTEQSHFISIKSLTVTEYFLLVMFNSSTQSILHLYSHHGHLLHTLPFFNEYISQIRVDNGQLWCLELISSSLFYFPIQSTVHIGNKTTFISFKDQSFDPFRFALNQTLVAIINRTTPGILRLYHRQDSIFIKQINSPLNNCEAYDIELTNQFLIYRFPHRILFFQFDNEQILEEVPINKNFCITMGKSSKEILISTFTSNSKRFLVRSFIKSDDSL